MSAANTVAELDFAKIKQNLIDTFRANPNFVDYDFSGSTISALLDMLAYVTHYQGVYANLAFAERFIDTAKIRNSIVSLSKELGYFPAQALPAIGSLNLSTPISSISGQPSTFVSNAKINFVGTTTDNVNHEFWSQTDLVFNQIGSNYVANAVLRQGTQITQRFVYTGTHRAEFILPNSKIDISSIAVRVKTNTTIPDAQAVLWSRAATFGGSMANSTIYYLEETTDNNLRLSFGDNVLGKALLVDNEIIVDYNISEGVLANSAKGFSISSSTIAGHPSNLFSITNEVAAKGGTDAENVEAIRINAPGVYAAQKRAVTITDYRALLLNQFPWIKSINVWGGENNVPPQYGQVYISIVPNYSNILDLTASSNILTYLKSVSIVGTGVNIIQPDILTVNTTSIVDFLRDKTTDSHILVESAVNSAIANYFTTTSGLLNQNINYSKLLAAIDASHIAIQSNTTTISLSMSNTPDTVHSTDVIFDFGNALKPNTIATQSWVSPSSEIISMKDDGNGSIFYVVNGVALNNSGSQYSVDYTTGVITLKGFLPNIVAGDSVVFNAVPVSNDLRSNRSSIIELGTTSTTAVLV